MTPEPQRTEPVRPSPERTPGIAEQPGDLLGPYKILEQIGEGGFGTVWMAEQQEPVRRKVALKVLKPGMDTALVVARFEAERQALARMEHPNIARVFDGGVSPHGRPYFAMELVRGVPITKYCDDAKLSPRARLELFIPVCEAVQHAHFKGIVHRDIKPGNVLVTLHDGVPVPKVIDFGIAKALQGHLIERTLFTGFQQMLGTPEYMAPEQAELSGLDIDTRADVYSLGVLLYELLTGTRPFDLQTLMEAGYGELLRTIREVDPDKPSTRVSTLGERLPGIARQRGLQPRALGALMRGELDWIVMKALEKERTRRYPAASALAQDIQRHLRNEPVEAGPPSRIYRLRKFARRHRAGVLVAAGALAGVLVFLTELQARNQALLAMNVDLDLATRTARENEGEAQRQESAARASTTIEEARRATAEESARRAKEQEARARHEKAVALELSAFQTLDDLAHEADELWPPDPVHLERYAAWLKKAEALGATLPGLRHSLTELQQRVLPGYAAERMGHPRAAELDQKRAYLTWLQRLLGEKPWPDAAAVEQALSQEALPADAMALHALVWPMVDPDSNESGDEVRCLLLAQRALARATPDQRPTLLDTLAWANTRVGRFAEALTLAKQALDEAQPAEAEKLRGRLKQLQGYLDWWWDAEAPPSGAQGACRPVAWMVRDDTAAQVDALAAEIARDLRARFEHAADAADTSDRWWVVQTMDLVQRIEDLQDPWRGLIHGISAEHGWGIERRRRFAADLTERSCTGPLAQARWSEAIRAIEASTAYGGWKLTPQMGLLPIGPDPQSGLWEFAHLPTGAPAVRGTDGKLALTEATGLVFVLLPGGTFWMGAQRTDPAANNYDARALPGEGPVHQVQLPPFFLSKFEMTQGQWERQTGVNPSAYRKGMDRPSLRYNKAGKLASALHPVTNVSWTDCRRVLKRLGLTLPTEAQWEYGCRAGTSSPYWSGDLTPGLGEVANVLDTYIRSSGVRRNAPRDADLEDGNYLHAAVGSYRANAFGLHEVHGNVWEWCRDARAHFTARKRVDPDAPASRTATRVIRGGSYESAPDDARSAYRYEGTPDFKCETLGLRPVKEAR